mmetsp:Transcript_60967/g.143561  ORF Transcript_60967/g.143561 Transcript_60967/m.143561 type:complete len:277 (-) Transcript_60967:2936-3766(-)
MKKLKSGWYAIVSSPILIMSVGPCLKICFASTGSNAGSSSSWTFSSKTGLPKRTALTSERKNSFSLILITSKPLFFCMFLIHLFAWPCGSIMSDHRRDLLRIMAFSVDRASVGSPAMFHARICTASDRVFLTPAPSVNGIPYSCSFLAQSCSCVSRYTAVNAPRYAMPPAAMMTSPTTFSISPSSVVTVDAQRTFSPPSPPSRRSARSSFNLQSSSLFASSSFLAFCVLNSFSSASRLSMTSFSCACSPASLASTSFSSAIAALYAIRFGSTSNAT